jgi:hypothetical protein
VGAKPGSDPGHHGGVLAGIPGWLSTRRAPDVPGQDLGCLIIEVTKKHAGAAGDPEGEVPAGVLAVLQFGDLCQKLIDDSLAARSHCWQWLPAVAALAHVSSPAQIDTIHNSRAGS